MADQRIACVIGELRETHLAAANSVDLFRGITWTSSPQEHLQVVHCYESRLRQSLLPIKKWLQALMKLLLEHQGSCVDTRLGKRLERQIRGVQEFINAVDIELLEVEHGAHIMTDRLMNCVKDEDDVYGEVLRSTAFSNRMRDKLRAYAVWAMDSNVVTLNDVTLEREWVPKSDFDHTRQTREMRKLYDVVQGKQLWCSVTRRFWPPHEHKMTQILPVVYGAENIALLLAKPESEGLEVIYSPRNSLPLMKTIPMWLEEFRAVIIPSTCDHDHDLWDYKLVILDWSIKDEVVRHPGGIIRAKDLHEKELLFRNDERPEMSYLAARYLMAVDARKHSLAQRYGLDRRVVCIEVKGTQLPWSLFWVATGFYMDSNIVREWMQLAGLVEGSERNPRWGELAFTSSVTSDRAKQVASDLRSRVLMCAMVDDDEYMLAGEEDSEDEYDGDC